MSAVACEWDETKADANLARHGVSFEQAQGALNDPFAIEYLDDCEAYS